MLIKLAKELNVYQKGYELAMQVFKLSKRFPVDERFALTSVGEKTKSRCARQGFFSLWLG
jgi:hypothetical protein